MPLQSVDKKDESCKISYQMERTFEIVPVSTPEQLAKARKLIVEYTNWLGIDLTYQGFEQELASLPGKYQPEFGGELLLAVRKGKDQADSENVTEVARKTLDDALGVVCLRRLYLGPEGLVVKHANEQHGTKAIGEIKRLYVRPEARSLGVGRALAKAILDLAERASYELVVCDTLSTMTAARRMYESVGFIEGKRYYGKDGDGPDDTVFLYRAQNGNKDT